MTVHIWIYFIQEVEKASCPGFEKARCVVARGARFAQSGHLKKGPVWANFIAAYFHGNHFVNSCSTSFAVYCFF